MYTVKQVAKDVNGAMNACNAVAIVRMFPLIADAICNEQLGSTKERNEHFLLIVMAEKILELAGIYDLTDPKVVNAFAKLRECAE